jgi:AcrR family transcriptional regulator
VREAERLWQTQGFEETTVGEICDAAGVSKGTFYFYFPHKEDLLIELGFPSDEEIRALDGWADEPASTEEALRGRVTAIARRVEPMPHRLLEHTVVEMYRSLGRGVDAGSEPPVFRQGFERLLRRGMHRGDVPPWVDADEVAAVLTTVTLGVLLAWARQRGRVQALDEMLWRRLSLVYRGALVAA